MGHRGGMRLPVSPVGISLSELAIRNRPRFEGVTRSGPLDLASFSSPLAQSAKFRPFSLPLVSRVLGLGRSWTAPGSTDNIYCYHIIISQFRLKSWTQ